MLRTAKFRHRPRKSRSRRSPRRRYLRIYLIIAAIIIASSFYIYQRVWVRALVNNNETLKERNENLKREVAQLRSDWAEASSPAAVENKIDSYQLGLRPTIPAQNLVLEFNRLEWDNNRFAGFIHALDKITGNLPLVTPSQAEAEELFEEK